MDNLLKYYKEKNFDKIKELLMINVNVHDDLYKTLLHFACKHVDIKLIQLILSFEDVDVNVQDFFGQTPLHEIVRITGIGHWDRVFLCNLLLEKGAKLDVRNIQGQTPLHLASFTGNDYIVHFLIEKGANKDIVDNEGLTPLHIAVIGNWFDVVKVLWLLGADVNKVDNDGMTPLEHAATLPDCNIQQFLIDEALSFTMNRVAIV